MKRTKHALNTQLLTNTLNTHNFLILSLKPIVGVVGIQKNFLKSLKATVYLSSQLVLTNLKFPVLLTVLKKNTAALLVVKPKDFLNILLIKYKNYLLLKDKILSILLINANIYRSLGSVLKKIFLPLILIKKLNKNNLILK